MERKVAQGIRVEFSSRAAEKAYAWRQQQRAAAVAASKRQIREAEEEEEDEIRCRCVADALVADPITRLPVTSSEISFYLTFPEVMAKQIIRGRSTRSIGSS